MQGRRTTTANTQPRCDPDELLRMPGIRVRLPGTRIPEYPDPRRGGFSVKRLRIGRRGEKREKGKAKHDGPVSCTKADRSPARAGAKANAKAGPRTDKTRSR